MRNGERYDASDFQGNYHHINHAIQGDRLCAGTSLEKDSDNRFFERYDQP